MKDQLLEIDVRLLILRYGRQPVLNVLARLSEQTPEELDQQLQVLELNTKSDRSKKSKPSLIEIAASECRERPDVSEPLRTLAVKFENRAFLPNLRDVQRFLDSIGAPRSTLKSRTVAGPILIRALSKLSRDELLRLATRDGLSRDSDYSLLSQAIMGTGPTGQRDKE